MDAQRALLDELMGTARDLTAEERKAHREVRWDDPAVCGPFMARFCPHDLFVNTKSDLGPCPRIHDPKLRDAFRSSPRRHAALPRFEAQLAHHCDKLVLDLDRKLRRGRDRLAQDAVDLPPPPPQQLSTIEDNIKNLLDQIEQLGDTGKIDQAEALMTRVDILNAHKAALTSNVLINGHKAAMLLQDKKMELCDTCGSFLVANDVLERAQSHVTGKQHIGFGMVRDFLVEYKAAREEERLSKEKEAEEHHKQRDRDYGNMRGTYREDHAYREDHGRGLHYERSRERERSYQQRGRGSDYRSTYHRNDRDSERARHRDRDGGMRRDQDRMRSRSRSPSRHGW